MLEPGRFSSSRFGGRGAGGGAPSLPRVALTVTPASGVADNAAVGTVVATITTDATSLILGGTDAALLSIDGTNVVTAGEIGGKESLSFSVTGERADYRSRTVSVTVLVDVNVPDDEAPSAEGGALQLADGKVILSAPDVTAGYPEPTTQLTALTRNGADILGELDEEGEIPDAVKSTVSTYSATWVISNGVGDPITITRTLEVAAAAITAVSEPTTARLYAGQTAAAIPNIATATDPANYSSVAGTIVSAQLQVNGEDATTSDARATGDEVSVLVTDDDGLTRRWVLSTVEYAVRFTDKGAGGWAVDINDLVPRTTNVTIGWEGETTTTTRNAIEAGPVVHIEPTISLDGEVFTVSNPGPWINEFSAGNISFAYQWRRNSTNITGATGETYTRAAADAGTTTTCRVTATDLNGSTAYTTTGIANPAAQVFEPFAAVANAPYRHETVTANTSTWTVDIGAAHANRDILVEAGLIGANGVTVTGCTIVAGGQTITPALVRAQASAAGTPNTHIALYHAKVPLGTSADITITTSANSLFRFIDYRRGVGNTISAHNGGGTSGGQNTVTVPLSGAAEGHKLLAFHARSAAVNVEFSGASEIYDVNPNADGTRYIAAAEGVIGAGGTASVQTTTPGTAQSALIVIAAGE